MRARWAVAMTEIPEIPWAEIRWRFTRGGGPGGQNVNKVASKAALRWNVVATKALPPEIKARLLRQQRNRINAGGELILESHRFRDQPRNRQDCVDRLRALIARACYQPPPRRSTRPTRASRERTLRAKAHRSRRKFERRPPKTD
jgi:ribosome-associated protein